MSRLIHGRLYQRADKIWEVRLAVSVSTGTTDKAEARKTLEKLVVQNEPEGSIGKLILDYLADSRESETAEAYAEEQAIMDHLSPTFWTMPVADLTTRRLQEYVRTRLAEKAAPVEIDDELDILYRAIARVKKRKEIPMFPILLSEDE